MSETFEVQFLPASKRVSVPAGTTLFQAANWGGLRIDSTCGGVGTCGRCRVQVQVESQAVSPSDQEHLSPEELRSGWRLACTAAVDQDTVCLASEIQEILGAAIVGEGRQVAIEPDLRKFYLEMDPPSEEDLRSDLERVQDGLRTEGLEVETSLDLLSKVHSVLQASKYRATAVISGTRLIAMEEGDTRDQLLAIAFDMGTTTVVGALLDLHSGKTLAVASALNRQAVFGGDVISRIAHTMSGVESRRKMQHLSIETVNHIVSQICETAVVGLDKVYGVVAVGNCTMLHFLFGIEARSIAVAPFVPVFRESVAVPAGKLGLNIHPEGLVETFPVVGAYVGADTVSGLHAIDLARGDELCLFIDVGTNSEIALGSARSLLATAAPAGPAFEGSCIRSGMAATAGAIEHVRLGTRVEIEVVGDAEAVGICGSGLIDTVAELLRAGLLDMTGRLSARQERAEHPLAEHLLEVKGERAFALTEGVRLTQTDIRELQSAKSSVSTGVRVLLESLGVGPEDLAAVLLAGSFGSSIDPRSALTIGLVPDLPPERIRFVGNTAIEGAKMALLSFRERQVAHDLARRIEYVELSARPDFNELFVDGLAFPDPSASSEQRI